MIVPFPTPAYRILANLPIIIICLLLTSVCIFLSPSLLPVKHTNFIVFFLSTPTSPYPSYFNYLPTSISDVTLFVGFIHVPSHMFHRHI